MELRLSAQGLSLLLSGAGGLGLGLFYDLLRPIRRRTADWLWDLLFCLGAALLCFCFAMRSESGRLGVWELGAALLGFCLYLNLLSPVLFPIFENFIRLFALILENIHLSLKKVSSFAKKLFANLRG